VYCPNITIYLAAMAMFSLGACTGRTDKPRRKTDEGGSLGSQGSPVRAKKTTGKKILVAYFSWSGNTRAVARHIAKKVDGELFEIISANAYPENYSAAVVRAKVELNKDIRPALKTAKTDGGSYDVIFLGYPNWWNTFPRPVATFLRDNHLGGTRVIPFCTHGGGGMGFSLKELRKLCPDCVIEKEIDIASRAVKSSMDRVDGWLARLGFPPKAL